ncbi:MAG: membrane protein insertion efficiency factor YidD [Ignavibacteriales bacterium]|nr:membrane protein insertion efficiency factor YidD [Ignavibacteriales bacterium]
MALLFLSASTGSHKLPVLFSICSLLNVSLVGENLAQQSKGSINQHDAWESTELRRTVEDPPSLPHPKSIFADLALNAIKYYQIRIAPLSIARCPFHPSCSHFAKVAIEKYGLIIGVALFVDRNLYRENPGIFQKYQLRKLSLGTLKLDDSHYLFGNP